MTDPVISNAFNPNCDFRNLPFGPKPVPRTLSGHLFGVEPRHLAKKNFVLRQLETRPRLTRQIPKLANPTSESGFKTIQVRRPEDSRAYRFDVEAVLIGRGEPPSGFLDERPKKFSRLFASGWFRENV